MIWTANPGVPSCSTGWPPISSQHGYDLKHLIATIMDLARLPDARRRTRRDHRRTYVFRGPEIRRLTAEQFADTLSADHRGMACHRSARKHVRPLYAREWRAIASPLTRALGRPIRDQVFTDAPTRPPPCRRSSW